MSEKEELPTLAKDEATLCHRHTSSVNHGILKDEIKWDYKAKKPFRVIIVGAGVAGLAAGIGVLTPASPWWPLLIDSQASDVPAPTS